MFATSLLLALKEIRRHKLRSFLTTLGIIIGVASVVTMVSLGNGATRFAERLGPGSTLRLGQALAVTE